MSTKPLIEIVGVWLPNKGAELMAHTTVAELSSRIPDAQFCSKDQGPRELREAIGIPSIVEPEPSKFERLVEKFASLDSWRWKRARKNVTHVVDISGFAYGDHWGENKAKNRAGRYIRAGFPVYILPQAFGPFSSEEFRKEMSFIVKNVREIAARDRTSQDHLISLGTGRPIPLLPDITLSLDVSDRDLPLPEFPYGCLVLNKKSISEDLTEPTVLSLYTQVADLMRSKGLKPIIVLHEPIADRDISRKLSDSANIEIVELDDARDIKYFISGAKCVVTGRFHGLVNGLSNSVPSLAVSWSHKYQQLLADYDCQNSVFDGNESNFLQAVDEAISSSDPMSETCTQLSSISQEKKALLSAFWDKIAEDISQGR